jgi:hypothetical protein
MAIETVAMLTGLALFGIGFLSGLGVGLTKRRKPSPPHVDVPEETMEQFERHREASIAFEKEAVVPTMTLH